MPAKKLKGLPPVRILQEVSQCRGKRGNWENLWQQIADFMMPTRDDIQNTSYPGEPKYNDLLDSTAMTYLELLAGALHGMLTNPSGYFFNMTTGDPDLDEIDSVRLWMQKVVRNMHFVLNGSNFQTEVQEMYLNLVGFGFSAMSMEEDDETVIRFGTRAIKEIFVKANSKGRIDTVYRVYKLDARGLVEEFGIDNMPDKVKKAYEKGRDDRFEVVHAVYPIPKHGPYHTKGPHKFISQYVLSDDKAEVSIGGFREFPFVTPRWSKAAGEDYGRGPGEKALPESKSSNKMMEITIRSAQKVMDPPLQAPDDGFVLPLITRPSGLNYYRAGSEDRIEPIFNNAQVEFGIEILSLKERKIKEAFYADELKLREGPQMTATEVQERVEQALRFLGPMLSRLQSEFLQPLIERLYAIMERKGMIPDVPAEIDGKPIRVQYSSVMAMTQRFSELQAIQRTMASVAPFISLDPTVADVFNGDTAARVVARLNNLPQEIINDVKSIAQIRKQRAEAQQKAEQMAQEQAQADSASKVISAGAKVMQGA